MTALTVLTIVGLIVIGIIIWDIYLAIDGRPRNTISQSIIDSNKTHPLLGWFIGFLMGALTIHLFE